MKFHLSEAQIKKIHHAAKTNSPVTLTLSIHDASPTGVSVKVDKNLLMDGKKHRITVAPPVITKNGGILPLFPILAGILAGLGGAAGIAGGVSATVKNAKESRTSDKMAHLAEVQTEMLQKIAAKDPVAAAQIAQGHGLNIKTGGFLPLGPALVPALAAASILTGKTGPNAIKSVIDSIVKKKTSTGGVLPSPALLGLTVKGFPTVAKNAIDTVVKSLIKKQTGQGLHLKPKGSGLKKRRF